MSFDRSDSIHPDISALRRLVHFAGDTLWQGEDDSKLVTLIRRNREVQVKRKYFFFISL